MESNLSAALHFLQIEAEDMIEFNLENQDKAFGHTPSYYIATDRRTSSIVLCIRGTMSIADSITDLACEYEKWNGGYVHSGFLKAARYFYKDSGIVDRLLRLVSETNTKSVVFIGHSLGGATASLLGLMMGKHFDDLGIDLSVYSYAAPPTISSGCLAEGGMFFTQANKIKNFIYGNDIVPSLSYGSMVELRELLIIASEYSSEVGGIGAIFHAGSQIDQLPTALIEALQESRASKNNVNYSFPKDSSDITCMECCNVSMLKLSIPGHIYHMYRMPVPKLPKFTVMEESSQDKFINEVSIKRDMLIHHLPSKYYNAFERIINSLNEESELFS